MVGRTPELLGKKIGARQMTYVALYMLVTPRPRARRHRPGDLARLDAGRDGQPRRTRVRRGSLRLHLGREQHGSAFGGITVTSDFFQITIGLAMLLGRLLPIVLVLLLAGSLAEQPKVPTTAGTLPTHRPLFVALLVGVVIVFTALTYFPALSLDLLRGTS